mgnify:CR=1 FL=1
MHSTTKFAMTVLSKRVCVYMSCICIDSCMHLLPPVNSSVAICPLQNITESFHDSDHMRHAETGWRSLIYEHLGSADKLSPVAPKAPSLEVSVGSAFCTEVPVGW